MSKDTWWVEVGSDYTNVESELETIAADVSNEHANLIAAAPDMAEHGQNLIESVMQRYGLSSVDDLTCPHMRGLAAAMAKARGES